MAVICAVNINRGHFFFLISGSDSQEGDDSFEAGGIYGNSDILSKYFSVGAACRLEQQ